MSTCPEALYGMHGETGRDGRCPYCGRKVGAKLRRPGPDYIQRQRLAREQDPRSIDPEYWDDIA